MRAFFRGQIIAMLVRRGMPAGCVLDVGARIGTPELIRAFPGLPHILFEPVAGLHDALAATCRTLSHQIVIASVSGADGEVELEMHTRKDTGALTRSGMVSGGVQRGGSVRTVPAITLDRYLAGRGCARRRLPPLRLTGPGGQPSSQARASTSLSNPRTRTA
ncbi:MAG: hypothetical protein ACXIVL_06760 [Oceanicaulis sp.]